MKKYILGALLALTVPALVASAATPVLNVSGSSNNSASVSVSGGDINSPVTLYTYNPTLGVYQGQTIGSTDINGTFSSSVNTNLMSSVNWNYPVYVSVGGYESSRVMWPMNSTTSSSNNVTFSQSSSNIGVGGTGSVSLSGGNGSYYILNNSNMGGVSASISGNNLNFYGGANGTANITVCSTGGGCGTFTANVGGSASPSLSSSNLTVNHGGQGSLTLSGGQAPYTVSVLNGTGVSTTMIGNTLYVNGNATGTNTLNICSANNGGCTPVTVNVQAAAATNTNTNTGSGSGTGNTSGFTFTLPLTVGQNLQLQLAGGGNGSYYIQSPMSSPALASLNGNTLSLNGQMMGTGTLTICQTGSTTCLPIQLAVGPASQPPLTGTGGGWLFTTNLGVGAQGDDVVELQKRLRDEGYFNANVTGYFGGATKAAVQRYQRAAGITATGFVGVQTRAILNQ